MNRQEIDEIRDETDKGIQKGYVHAATEWCKLALEVVYDHALTHESFTVNDVRPRIDSLPVKTQDKRAMGGVMRKAIKASWVAKSGETITSQVGHLSPLQVWRSLVYGKQREAGPVVESSPSASEINVFHPLHKKGNKITCTCLGARYGKICHHIKEHFNKQNGQLFPA